MTIDEIKACDRALLRPVDIAPILGCHPYEICIKARNGTLEFPFFRSGNRTKIPRIPFIIFITGHYADDPKKEEPLTVAAANDSEVM